MKCTGIKFVCELSDKQINTWNQEFNIPIEDIIRKKKYVKRWEGGKFLEIFLHFEDENRFYHKVNVDIENSNFNLLLGT